MSDYVHYGYTSQISEDFPADIANSEEQYDDNSSIHQNKPWATTTSSDSLQFCQLQAYRQSEGHPQTAGQFQGLSPMPMDRNNRIEYGTPQGYGGQGGGLHPYECIDPALLTMSGTSHGHAPSFNMYGHQYHQTEAHLCQPQTPLAYVDVRQRGQYSAMGGSSNGFYAVVPEQYGRSNEMYADSHRGHEYPNPTPASAGTLPDAPSRGPDSMFIPGVLERQQDHREQLGLYTDRLLHRLGEPKVDGLVQPSLATSPATISHSYSGSMDGSHARVVPPQPLQAIQAQGSHAVGHANQVTEESIPRWSVREGTPVLVDLSASDSRSR